MPSAEPGTGQVLIVHRRRLGCCFCPSAASRHHFCQSEVENLGVAALSDENVGWLDVAVDDAFGVSGVERVGDLDGQG